MTADIWIHIRNKERELGHPPISQENVEDAQAYYQWLCDTGDETRVDGHNDC